MKLLAAIAILASTTFCPPAKATSPIMEQREVFHDVKINGEQSGLVAVLDLDFMKKEIQINLYRDVCGQFDTNTDPNVIRCMAAAMLKEKLVVPMEKAFADSCGSAIYVGAYNDMPRDGFLTEIEVKDHRDSKCDRPFTYYVEVDAKRTAARSNEVTTYTLRK
jgi:hypothetical protein